MRELILDYLETSGIPYKVTGDEWILSKCFNPKHNDKSPSLSINTETGAGKCFGCGFTIHPIFWIKGEINDKILLEMEAKAILNKHFKKKDEPKEKVEFKLPIKTRDVEAGWRGLEEDTINKLDLFITDKGRFKNRVIFPFYNSKKKLQGFNSRALGNETPKYLYSKGIDPYSIIYPAFNVFDIQRSEVVIVEGIIDAILMNQVGLKAIFNFGTANIFTDKKIEYLLSQGIETLVLALDKDEAGFKGNGRYLSDKKIRKYFDIKLVKEYKPLQDFFVSDYKDFSDYYLSLIS